MHHCAQLLFLIPTLQRHLSWAQERQGRHSHAERGNEGDPHAPAASELGAGAPGAAFPRRAWEREININLSASDLESLATLAQQFGVSVSLLMSTVLHQFVASRSV